MEDLSEIIERGIISAKANDILTPELAAKIGAVHGTYLPDKGILVAARDYNNNNLEPSVSNTTPISASDAFTMEAESRTVLRSG